MSGGVTNYISGGEADDVVIGWSARTGYSYRRAWESAFGGRASAKKPVRWCLISYGEPFRERVDLLYDNMRGEVEGEEVVSG